jgi:uncharacterized protein (TIGR03382 family)
LGKSLGPKELTVTNQSNLPKRMLAPEVTNPDDFTVEALEPGKEIPPGGTTTLHVTFHPNTAGEHITGEIRLRLLDEQVTDATIDLHGKGQKILPEDRGCSSGPSAGGPLLAGWLLLLMVHRARRRSHAASR